MVVVVVGEGGVGAVGRGAALVRGGPQRKPIPTATISPSTTCSSAMRRRMVRTAAYSPAQVVDSTRSRERSGRRARVRAPWAQLRGARSSSEAEQTTRRRRMKRRASSAAHPLSAQWAESASSYVLRSRTYGKTELKRFYRQYAPLTFSRLHRTRPAVVRRCTWHARRCGNDPSKLLVRHRVDPFERGKRRRRWRASLRRRR